MSDFIIMLLISTGALFILLAAIGIVRMPDFYMRLSVTTKAVTLGLGLVLISTAIYFDRVSVTSRVIAIIFFLFLTAPVGAHMIGRASYFTGIRLWNRSVADDLEGMYKKDSHELMSGQPDAGQLDEEHTENNDKPQSS